MQAHNFTTETYKQYFTNRIVYLWNTLPYDIRSTESFYTFNRQLRSFSMIYLVAIISAATYVPGLVYTDAKYVPVPM